MRTRLDLGCLIYKYRIIVPPSLREKLLREINESHLGINKIKKLSRNYVYWPSLDKDIENLCRNCDACRIVRDAPPKAILHPWEFPLHPWQRIHADFAEYAGKKYFIMIDAHSKWIEVFIMSRTDAEATIAVLRTTFARFGHPLQLVTDNGPPFASLDFNNYCLANCIKHVSTAPYRSQVALLGHRLRGRLDAIRPDRAVIAREAQNRQAPLGDFVLKKGSNRLIEVGDTVLARDYRTRSNKWSEGVVTDKTGPSSYKVDVGEGLKWRRHQDQIINVDNKNRYSLARTSLPSSEVEGNNYNENKDIVTYDADDT
ncbi:unnamed protein product, partial [Brenthis ino]